MTAVFSLLMFALLASSHITLAVCSYERGKATKVPKCPKCKKFYKVQEGRLGRLYRIGCDNICNNN